MPVASDLRQEPGADTKGAAKQKAARWDLCGGAGGNSCPYCNRRDVPAGIEISFIFILSHRLVRFVIQEISA
jgi:hypothetical protein